jgi:hypothetical protein
LPCSLSSKLKQFKDEQGTKVALIKFLISMSLIFHSSAFAEPAKSPGFYSPELAAKVFASTVNDAKSAKKVLARVHDGLSAEEMANIEKLFKKSKVDINAPLPTIKVSGAVVTWPGNKMVFNEDRSIALNGTTKRSGAQQSDLFMEEYLKSNSAPQTKSSLFLNQAQAVPLIPVLVVVFLLMAAKLISNVRTANAYIKETNASGKPELYCNQKGEFQVRPSALLPKGEVIDFETVSQFLMRKVKTCDQNTADDLRIIIIQRNDADMERMRNGSNRGGFN